MQQNILERSRGMADDASPSGAEPAFSRSSFGLLVADYQEIIAVGFRMLLGSQPWVRRCLHATSPEDVIERVRRYQPHVLLMALEMADSSGNSSLLSEVNSLSPGTRLLLMSSGRAISAQSLRALRACGYVSKLWPVQDTLAVIRAAGLGLEFAPGLPGDQAVQLSGREHEVLMRIASGATNREIAEELFLSPHTVKQHASAAFKKIRARNRTDAVDRARRLGLL